MKAHPWIAGTILIFIPISMVSCSPQESESDFGFVEPSPISNSEIPVNEYRCSTVGFFPDPRIPQKFYECAKSPTNPSVLISYTYRCPPDECFDKRSTLKCTASSCSTSSGNQTEEFECLKGHLQQDAQLICQEETLSVLGKQLTQLVQFTATRGDPFENLRLSLRDAHMNMRENYAKMIENVGKNIYPLIVATDSEPDMAGVGGVFKVYLKDGTMRRIVPVGPAFEIYKCLSHMVLGVFAIVSPYFQNPNSTNWQVPLKTFQGRVKDVIYLLSKGESRISNSEKKLAQTMLKKVDTYINDAVKANSVEVIKYFRFATDLAPYIDKSMELAAKAHAEDTVPALQQLKTELGSEWKNAYVIIPTVWPVSLYNIRLQALEKVMSFDQIKSQVLIVEGARTEADARTTLGRIIADRALAQLVFGGLEEPSMKDHVFSLSTRRDLLSSTAARELDNVCRQMEKEPDKPKCPFAGRTRGVPESRPRYATMLRS